MKIKICANTGCENEVPLSIYDNGKRKNLCNRKYCFECSPFKSHNTVKLERIDSKKRKGKDNECKCLECGRVFIYKRGQGHQINRCNSCVVREHRIKLGQRAIDYKGGKCEECGYNKCNRALSFHHKNPEEKEFAISKAIATNRKWGYIREELDKCILVCSNCHMEIEDAIIEESRLVQG